MTDCLLIVDMQRDFIDGSLAVLEGSKIIEPIRREANADYGTVVASMDWHPPDHMSFSDNGGIWPRHCEQFTEGAALDSRIAKVADAFIYKGFIPSQEAYSAFDGYVGFRPGTGQALVSWLHDRKVRTINVCGLALDYCVRATALSARAEGFKTNVVLDLTRPVAYESGAAAIAELAREGIGLLTT